MDADGVTDKNAMAGAVRGLLASGFSGGRVNVLVSKSNVISNEFVLPYEKNPIAMRNIVQGELYKSQTSDDSILDYTIQEVFPRDGSTFCRVQAYLAKRSLVESVSEILSLAGKKPSCYTVVQNCLCRLQHLGNGFSGGDIIIANVGSSRIHVTLLAQPNIALTRSDAVMPGRQALAAVVENRYDISAATEAATQNISKMMQYQSIKYPGRPAIPFLFPAILPPPKWRGTFPPHWGTRFPCCPARPPYPHRTDFCSTNMLMRRGRCSKNEKKYENNREYVPKYEGRADRRKSRKFRFCAGPCVHCACGMRRRRVFPYGGARRLP
ncbi:MAG: hypothetical protein DELT_03239 [Desulfovibrio sp.]